MTLTYLDIQPQKGNAALLPNQPIIQGCEVYGEDLHPGDAVILAGNMVVMKANEDELAIGVVAGNPLKTTFVQGEKVSVFPIGSFVYLVAGADIYANEKLSIDEDGNVVPSTNNPVLGMAWTSAQAGELVIVQIKPELSSQLKQNAFSLGDNMELVEETMYAWEGELEDYPVVYTKSDTPEATGVVVYISANGIFEKFVDDATYADGVLTITLSGHDYDYEANPDFDSEGQFLTAIVE